MPEQILSGGYFGDSYVPAAPSSAAPPVVHGGFFGGVPVREVPPLTRGWAGSEDRVFLSALRMAGTPCEFQPEGKDPFIVHHGAIFRDQHVQVDPSAGVKFTTTQPHAGVRRTEVPEHTTPRDLVICQDRQGRDRLFTLADLQPDGEVGAKLMLHEVKA